MQDIEKIVHKIKEILNDNILTKLQALEAEYGDGIELPKPVIYITPGIPGEDAESILISSDTSTVVSVQNNYNLTQHRIMITAWLVESEHLSILTKKIFRYTRAILELMLEKYQLENTVLRNTVESINYSPVFKVKKVLSFFKGSTIILLVAQEQFV